MTTCPNLGKHHKSKDKDFCKTKGKSSKGRRAYIALEEDVESSYPDSCSSLDDECANFCLMTRKKCGTSKVYNSYYENEYTYSELLNAFNDMYIDSIKVFKKISLQKEMISKLEKEINNLNRALDCLNEAHTSLMDERCNV